MLTDNEQLLQDKVNELSSQIEYMGIQMVNLTQALEANSAGNISDSYSQSFFDVQTVDLYLPFYFTDDCTLSVIVEDSPGFMRTINPSFTISGTQITLQFDRPYTGSVVVGCDIVGATASLPTPTVPYNNELVLSSDVCVLEEVQNVGEFTGEITMEMQPTDAMEEFINSPSSKSSGDRLSDAMKGI